MHTWSIARMGEALRAREVSSVELTKHFLDRIERFNPQLNAVLQTDGEGALRSAEQADKALASGQATGRASRSATTVEAASKGAPEGNTPLLGIPLIHKDIFCTTGLRTTCGSRMLENYESPFDATVVAKLKAAGSVILGKANMDEFAMGSSNENSYFGAVANPWDDARVPGGSSGGSAAVVAAGLAPVATGTDTGGSIRQPAALCGITGIKPTYGRVSRYGMIAFASSLDQGGPLARSAEDCAIVLGQMAGFDPRDSTSSDVPVPDYTASLETPLKGLRIGVPREYFGAGLDDEVAKRVNEGLAELEREGAILVSVSLPNQHLCVPAYYVVAPAEASSNLSRYDGVRFGHRCENPVDLEDLYLRSRSEGFGVEVKRRILVGTYALSAGYYDAYYRRAQQVRRLISDDFTRAFESVDMIAGPTTPTTAFARGTTLSDPIAMYLNDLFTVSANLSGLPALSMPCGLADGLPVGLQLMGKAFGEGRLLSTAHRFQQLTDWHRQMPAHFD